MRRVIDTVASIWSWSVLITGVAAAFPLILLWRFVGWPVDRWNYLGGRLFRVVARLMVGLTPRWRFERRGVIPADPRRPYVVVANHESFADIVLLSTMPWEMKWLSKAALMRLPIFGWTMWAARDVAVHRGQRASARDAMAECTRRLRGRMSVMIFPEGTRSRTEEMLPFKDGAFRLAIDEGVPLLPIVVCGTREAIAAHDWRIGRTHAVAEVLEPEPTVGLTVDDLPALKSRVRERIRERRDALRQELAGEDARRGEGEQ